MRDIFAQVHSILFSFPIPKRKDRLEKYSNPGIGDTVKRFYGAELCQSSRRTATRASSVQALDLFEVILDAPKSESTHLLNLVVLDVLDHSGQLHSRLSEELWHRHSGYPVVLQGGAAVMVEITFLLLVLVLSALHHYYRHHPISQPLFHYPSASLDYTHLENRTSQTPPRKGRASSMDEPSGIYALPAISEIPLQ